MKTSHVGLRQQVKNGTLTAAEALKTLLSRDKDGKAKFSPTATWLARRVK